MSEGVPATLKKTDVSLVELERQLEGALIEYERLCQAWPEESHVLSRAKAGRQVEDALGRIYELHRAITGTQAKTLPDAAAKSRLIEMSANCSTPEKGDTVPPFLKRAPVY